jgi:hypothetical protein
MTAASVRAQRSGGTASDVDRLLATVTSVVQELPEDQRDDLISVERFLAMYARRQHGGDLTAAYRTLESALLRLGRSHTPITPVALARRIELSRRPVRPVRHAGGAR